MSRRHRIIFLLGLGLALGVVGCGNKKEVEHAKKSVYDIDFAIVYSAALEATRELYPSLDDNPGKGAIKTAWHQVSYANNSDDLANQRTLAQGQGVMGGGQNSSAAAAAGMPTRMAYKRNFIRFDVIVTGGRPWRVRVVGHASEWEPGNALPTELTGPARPHWLAGRTDALQLAIYKRMKPYAIPMKEEIAEVEERPEDRFPKTDPKLFANVPKLAAERLAKLKDSLVRRDYTGLRAQLADDVVWNLGAEPGADTAMAMWQADPESLDAMVKLITEGCAGNDKRVACPSGDPVTGKFQLVIELRGADWKLVSFLRSE